MTIKISIILLTILLNLSVTSFSQEITIAGELSMKAQNISHSGDEVFIANKSKIISISGDQASFSLRTGNTTKYQFFYKNGYSPVLNSIIIEPGTYKLYPNLPPNTQKVFIEIILKEIK